VWLNTTLWLGSETGAYMGRISVGFSREYFRVLAGIFPYFTNKFTDLTRAF